MTKKTEKKEFDWSKVDKKKYIGALEDNLKYYQNLKDQVKGTAREKDVDATIDSIKKRIAGIAETKKKLK